MDKKKKITPETHDLCNKCGGYGKIGLKDKCDECKGSGHVPKGKGYGNWGYVPSNDPTKIE